MKRLVSLRMSMLAIPPRIGQTQKRPLAFLRQEGVTVTHEQDQEGEKLP